MGEINLEEVKRAILKAESAENEEIFSRMLPLLKDKLNGYSILYVVSGFLMLLDYMRFAPGEAFFSEVRRSGMVGKVIETLGEEISLLDIFSGMILGKGFDLGFIKFRVEGRHLEKLKEITSKYRGYMMEMARYCSENDLHPEEVLEDPKAHSQVIERAWGSVEGYIEYEIKLMEDFRGWISGMEKVLELPIEPIAPMLIKARINRDPEELGLSEKAIEEMVKSFKSLLSDVVLIVDLFISEKRRSFEGRMGGLIDSS
ncbi:hypothetical protein J7M22_19165 [Candidatus Poribacteria bacterium]|nr:hypothetical protein [Candidatus Poribacteria bacterium]